MTRMDDNLREALSQLAEEETEQFARSMTREERRNAEALFKRHRSRALSLIARRFRRGKRRGAMALRAAAVLILIAGGAILFFRQSPPEPTPLSPGLTASVSPYYTDAPISTPVPTDSPTFTPIPTENPTSSPTEAPAPTPDPTLSPTAEPTPESTPAQTAAPVWQDVSAPAGWGGSAFPSRLPGGYFPNGIESKDGVHTAIYSNGDDQIVFMESESLSSLPFAEGADVTYVQWDDVVAMRAERNGQVQLTWDALGRSFSLLSTGGQAEEIAASVTAVSK